MGWTAQQAREHEIRVAIQKRLASEERTRLKIREKHETPAPVAGLQDTVSEPQSRTPLVAKARRANRRIHRAKVRVSIISVRHRLLDSDNVVAGAKQARDVIAEMLGCSDDEQSGIEWEYDQILTRGTEGTLLRIEQL